VAGKAIEFPNGFRAMASLRKANDDPRVAEIEGAGMENGRVFVHLETGFWFGPHETAHSRSVGSAAELRDAMRDISPCDCADCQRKRICLVCGLVKCKC